MDNIQVEDAEFEKLDPEKTLSDTESIEPEPDKQPKSAYPTQVVLTIRTIVGGYLVYLAYQIITSGSKISAWMWAPVILFIIAGAALVVMSVKHFICGEYEGGKKDENR